MKKATTVVLASLLSLAATNAFAHESDSSNSADSAFSPRAGIELAGYPTQQARAGATLPEADLQFRTKGTARYNAKVTTTSHSGGANVTTSSL